MIARILLAPWLLAHCGGGGGVDGEACMTSDVGAPVDRSMYCGQPDVEPWERSSAARMRVSGDNGVFTDTCIEGCGAVLQFECELVPWCSEYDDHCGWAESGRVLSKIVFCPCVNGRCLTGCPFTGDTVHVEGVATAEKATLVDDSTGRRYACKPWGCSPPAGAKVTSVGGGWCTEGEGDIDVGWCGFTDCALLP